METFARMNISAMSANTKIAVFYHCARLGEQWSSIDAEIMRTMTASGLLDRADVFVRNDCRDIGLFEFPTLEMVARFAVQNPEYLVLYLHTKGASHQIASVADWRACMLYWIVERWQECVAKFERNFDAVGVSVVDTPIRHFQGNFWWATAKHIATLPEPRSIEFIKAVDNQGERHKCEFWILSQPAKVYTPYHHHLNPYRTRNPRNRYEGRPF